MGGGLLVSHETFGAEDAIGEAIFPDLGPDVCSVDVVDFGGEESHDGALVGRWHDVVALVEFFVVTPLLMSEMIDECRKSEIPDESELIASIGIDPLRNFTRSTTVTSWVVLVRKAVLIGGKRYQCLCS